MEYYSKILINKLEFNDHKLISINIYILTHIVYGKINTFKIFQP
jgi:hypothetical protein